MASYYGLHTATAADLPSHICKLCQSRGHPLGTSSGPPVADLVFPLLQLPFLRAFPEAAALTIDRSLCLATPQLEFFF